MTQSRKRTAKPTPAAEPKPTDTLTDRSIADAIDAAFAEGVETISATALADILSRKPKNLRAYLRSAKLRDQSSEKGNGWKLSVADAVAVAAHYEAPAETEEA